MRALPFVVILALLCGACGKDAAEAPPAASSFIEVTRPIGGLEASVTIGGGRGAGGFEAAQAALDEVERVLRELDAHAEGGALARIAAGAGGAEPVKVGRDVYGTLSLALDLARRTKGAYDPTSGGGKGGWQRLELHPPTRSVRLQRAGLALDLAGVAEGFAAQSAWASLGMAGFPICRVRVGAVVVGGEPAEDVPRWPADSPHGGRIGLVQQALAVSPDGAAVVVASDAPSAAAYARALQALPVDEGLAAAAGTAGVEASVRLEDGTIRATAGFSALLLAAPSAGK